MASVLGFLLFIKRPKCVHMREVAFALSTSTGSGVAVLEIMFRLLQE